MEAKTSKMVSLNYSNYHIWKNKMRDILLVTKLHLPVFSSAKPEGKTDEDWEFEHQEVCSYIRQFVNDNVYNHICDENDAKTLWSKLERLYASKTDENKLFFQPKLVHMRYKDDTSLENRLGGSKPHSMEARASKMVSLNGSNYHIWRNRMRDILYVTKLHSPVFSPAKPKGKTDEDWKFDHQQVCSYIRQFVDDNVYNHICDENDAKSLWSKLEELYASKNGNNKLLYLTKLMQMKYKDDTSLTDHLNEIQGVVNQLSYMGIKMEDEMIALLVLASLPESWETLKVSLTCSTKDGIVSLEAVKSAILNEEMRKRSQGASTSSSQSGVLTVDSISRRSKTSREKTNKFCNVGYLPQPAHLNNEEMERKSKSKSRVKESGKNRGAKSK